MLVIEGRVLFSLPFLVASVVLLLVYWTLVPLGELVGDLNHSDLVHRLPCLPSEGSEGYFSLSFRGGKLDGIHGTQQVPCPEVPCQEVSKVRPFENMN